MIENSSDTHPDDSATQPGAIPADGAVGRPAEAGFTVPAADRPPTEDEAATAERLAADVDIDRVGEHYEQAVETGANIRGEGEITPE